MSEAIDINVAARKLAKVDNVLILCHKNPDGDTLGSAGALYWALHSLGKKAAVFCSDPIHERYQYMELEQFYDQFEPQYVVAVDIAGTQLFGERSAKWADKVDMCIDHHGSNTGFADQMLLDATAAATCEIMYTLIVTMGVEVTGRMADCLYTGVSTDTGCFKFANTTASTHRVAARLIDLGANLQMLNELLFENKSKERIAVEQLALSTLEYHFEGCCALICLTRDQIAKIGADEADLEGITSLPRSIDGVLVGITMRQQPGGSYKISVRTKVGLNATEIVRGLGGGGHAQAAGCEIFGGLDYAKAAILAEAGKALEGRIPPRQPEKQPAGERQDHAPEG
ncbi:MAG: bifunctional oligoribonuclease/PAP phosphatase NrnA [Ruminococcaceae bacterium]|nr:bifunctional oligoribonuclease/PAP phosphatase NrnA [Oscillospiraceae bacterium]